MSHQAKVIRLEQLALTIRSETIKILPGALDSRKLAHKQLAAKIDGWEQSIKLVQRDMKSQSNFNHMIHRHNPGGRKDHDAGQRLKSGEENVKLISNALDKVIDALEELSAQFHGGDNAETRALKGIGAALKNWSKTAKHSETGIIGTPAPANTQATIQQAKPFLPQGAPGMTGPGAIDAFTLVLGVFVLLKSLTKKKD
ncbi:hypothetical protein FHS72_002562 [Loktanella ponticola]|uniref:Uncharacterized protein n=1 Tax=Yoonia ponticola TaxID=1524255 RepID=A0A7W9BM92_9RHOB|nr:hypothetical protein [Yoonia ponticola]MBB5722926.1 hypothetical protein [Yoonia ponticola]